MGWLQWANVGALVLTVTFIICLIIWIRRNWSRKSHGNGSTSQKIPIRKNVLLLVGLGYFTVMLFFGAMCWKGGLEVEVAYDVIKGPLMTLVGGSLAIAKDLIPLQDEKKPSESQRATGQGSDELPTKRHTGETN